MQKKYADSDHYKTYFLFYYVVFTILTIWSSKCSKWVLRLFCTYPFNLFEIFSHTLLLNSLLPVVYAFVSSMDLGLHFKSFTLLNNPKEGFLLIKICRFRKLLWWVKRTVTFASTDRSNFTNISEQIFLMFQYSVLAIVYYMIGWKPRCISIWRQAPWTRESS